MDDTREKYREMKKLLKQDSYTPHEKKRFYELKIDLLKAKEAQYEFWPEEKENIRKKRLKTNSGLAIALDELRASET